MRVLITTVTAGAGHLQAANALEEAWRALQPGDTVRKVDLLDLVPRLQRDVYTRGYAALVKHAAGIWGMVFKKTDDPELMLKLTRIRRVFARHTNRRFIKLVKEFKPDAVICTHFLPVEIMGLLKAKGLKLFTACVITDFEAHALWLESAIDMYFVAAATTQASLAVRGIPASRILVTGIPISLRFSQPLKPRLVRKALGLRDDLPIVLVLGGGFGMGPVAEILTALGNVQASLQVVVVAGRNERLRRELASKTYRHPTRVQGFVDNMHELMAVSDLIVTKPGGLTSSEALALGKPLLILDPIPGQETANGDFLLERGAASKINRVQDLSGRIDDLLGSKRLRELARAARKIGRARAAETICQQMIDRWNSRGSTSPTQQIGRSVDRKTFGGPPS